MTWNPFKKTTDEQPAEQDEPAASKESGAKTTEGKGRPTPKRKEAQARNLRPLAPKDRQASAKAAKQRIRAKEDAEYEAMQNGDIRHMPKSEQLPWRVYIRDYVDARWRHMSEAQKAEVMRLGYDGVLTERGIGGIANWDQVRCLHTQYAHHLCGDNVIGRWMDAEYGVADCLPGGARPLSPPDPQCTDQGAPDVP